MNVTHDARDGVAAGGVRALWSNLRAGIAIALLRAPRFIVGTMGQVACLALLNMAVTVLTQAAMAGLAGEFDWAGLGGALMPVALFVVAAGATSALAGTPGRAPLLVAGMLAATFWIAAFTGAAFILTEHVRLRGALAYLPWALAYGALAWIVLAFAVLAARLLPLSWPGRLAAVAIATAAVAWPQLETAYDRSIWTRAPDPGAGQRAAAVAAAAGEGLLYSQPAVLARELDALQPRRAGVPNLYLVSVAGYAEQDVFMREVMTVDALFADRFGTHGRSVRLVNSRATMRDIPLATRTSLADALRKVGSLMNPEEDLLFLFLTSHGRPGQLSLTFYPLSLADLTPIELRRMLDDAGIRYRVIVVSACYSGSFVEALRNDDSLVITASAQDRNSFGCSNEADFTYFGKAFFDEALRTHGSFLAAFDAALPVIAGREKAEDYPPSLPQRAVGAGILPRLAAWQATLGAEKAAKP